MTGRYDTSASRQFLKLTPTLDFNHPARTHIAVLCDYLDLAYKEIANLNDRIDELEYGDDL